MAQDPSRTLSIPDAGPHVKFRLRFRKHGDLRLVSHHDLMHCFARMLRRADLPVAHSQGFHPQPRLVFALSLALGIVGCREVVEVELTRPLDAAEVLERLRGQAPAGLDFLSCRIVPRATTAQVRRVRYGLPLPVEREVALRGRVQDLLGREAHWIDRRRPQPRRLNLRAYLHDLAIADQALEATLWVAANGTIRPEELLAALEAVDLLEAGGVLQRRDLELVDEAAPDAEPLPSAEWFQAAAQPLAPKDESPDPDRRAPTSLVAGPLSFDS